MRFDPSESSSLNAEKDGASELPKAGPPNELSADAAAAGSGAALRDEPGVSKPMTLLSLSFPGSFAYEPVVSLAGAAAAADPGNDGVAKPVSCATTAPTTALVASFLPELSLTVASAGGNSA